MKNSDKPITPLYGANGVPFTEATNIDVSYIEQCRPLMGLTKREYFAAMAMQGLLSNPEQINTTNFEWVAVHSVGYADELLKQLEQ